MNSICLYEGNFCYALIRTSQNDSPFFNLYVFPCPEKNYEFKSKDVAFMGHLSFLEDCLDWL